MRRLPPPRFILWVLCSMLAGSPGVVVAEENAALLSEALAALGSKRYEAACTGFDKAMERGASGRIRDQAIAYYAMLVMSKDATEERLSIILDKGANAIPEEYPVRVPLFSVAQQQLRRQRLLTMEQLGLAGNRALQIRGGDAMELPGVSILEREKTALLATRIESGYFPSQQEWQTLVQSEWQLAFAVLLQRVETAEAGKGGGQLRQGNVAKLQLDLAKRLLGQQPEKVFAGTLDIAAKLLASPVLQETHTATVIAEREALQKIVIARKGSAASQAECPRCLRLFTGILKRCPLDGVPLFPVEAKWKTGENKQLQ